MLQSSAELIVHLGKLLFERRLLDIAGGNISCRVGDQILMTPTGAGQDYLWDLRAEDLLMAPIASDLLLEDPRHSREALSHLYVYREYLQVGAIIHAHPFHTMPFCAAVEPIPALTLAAQMYASEFTFIAELPMYSSEQALDIVDCLRLHKTCMDELAAVVLMPKHGIFIAARDLKNAADCLERVDTNAYCALAQRWISG